MTSNESRNVEVGLTDLRAFIESTFEKDVRKQAEVMVITQPGNSSAEVAFEFDRLVAEAEPAARARVELRYRHLLEALKSGDRVDRALKAFLRRD
jgi:hypothetical protein